MQQLGVSAVALLAAAVDSLGEMHRRAGDGADGVAPELALGTAALVDVVSVSW